VAEAMNEKLVQVVLAILVGLMGWNFKTLNEIQLQMETVMYKYADLKEINELKIRLKELEWRLNADAGMK
jgi:hypothetical protein